MANLLYQENYLFINGTLMAISLRNKKQDVCHCHKCNNM